MKKTLAMIATSLLIGNAAMAQDGPPAQEGDGTPPPHHGRMMKEMDTNGDEVITKAEASAFHAKKFDAMDTNKDGKLTKDEREAFRKAHAGKWRKHGESK